MSDDPKFDWEQLAEFAKRGREAVQHMVNAIAASGALQDLGIALIALHRKLGQEHPEAVAARNELDGREAARMYMNLPPGHQEQVAAHFNVTGEFPTDIERARALFERLGVDRISELKKIVTGMTQQAGPGNGGKPH